MDEKRRFKRLPVDIHLTIDSLYRQDHTIIELPKREDIEIVDVSKSGVGFVTACDLPMGYYFNARIEMDVDKSFYGVLKIIRKQEQDNMFHYGSEFVGLADILTLAIDDYAKEHNLD